MTALVVPLRPAADKEGAPDVVTTEKLIARIADTVRRSCSAAAVLVMQEGR
ncbi:hypothetical protein [Pseudofrankia sp. BMG5.37]|uniref:hypothetical protein n=1 Tax=Pseudofrankia sp. BMG5.37 TaxID=3050035 RepID=UPI00289442F3|nr:hypothetical protein [Pseudofrankia sp. BMG5.37]MDT3446841.1 hypothetical protein [Pseudofrankia sp. BMG5.37]